ncbi:helix-turn-helix transcriptional regulator [Sphingomonas sp. JC676]|uniref:helix-turn-helix transcriptional regulator n=1 Tax=Sphingomonas sp. JC676 TaxID=2768065 RepID=UPI001CA6E793|nr:LuxR C-terminal-related transcriptional regulator [Sphingomonas sp. JC676]
MPETDFSALNHGERTALDLLAQGHTAKSIAQITGRSVTSVNERLREARRKTGVGSSRELARLLAAQENRDKQIGVAAAAAVAAGPGQEAAVTGVRGLQTRGAVLMGFTLLSGIAALAMISNPASAPQQVPGDAEFNITFPDARMDTRNLYAQLRGETRDPAWAAPREQALRARYARLVHAARMARPVRVTCGATLCEVAGVMPTGDEKLVNETMSEMQGGELDKEMGKLGFKNGGQLFTGGSFITYWLRKEP